MYFIAYLVASKLHVIVPKTWIFEIDKHWEKFVNKSINRNQKHLCFYSERAGAMIDRGDDIKEPNTSFKPDFSFQQENEFPDEGCYIAKLIYYKGMLFKTHILIFYQEIYFVVNHKKIILQNHLTKLFKYLNAVVQFHQAYTISDVSKKCQSPASTKI